MLWYIAGIGTLLVLLSRIISLPFWYASALKRRAMRVAFVTYTREHPDSKPVWSGSWVYRADEEKCFVFVKQRTTLHPPTYSVYVIWHNREVAHSLGGWQFQWGITPQHAVECYESRREDVG